MANPNSFDSKESLKVGESTFEIFRLDALQSRFDVARLPYSLKILLENLLRTEGNGSVDAKDIEATIHPGRLDETPSHVSHLTFHHNKRKNRSLRQLPLTTHNFTPCPSPT